MLNIPDIVCVYMLGVLAQHDIRKHTAATTTVKLIYVTNTCVSMLLHICWNERTFPLFVGV